MLFSVYQNHEQLKMLSERISKECGIDFVYRDYRHLSECSKDIAKRKMIYRQGYCGCIFSEYERYKDTTREIYKGGKQYDCEGENVPVPVTTKKEPQGCDCFG
jgi:predicted adenine nucleotide alpha hydrolase (AANH) superfamily ATPase